MKRVLSILFVIHLSLIFIQSIYLTIDAYTGIHYNRKNSIPVFSFLKLNVYNSRLGMPYFILSGTNTGYGFYGIRAATEKYFTATFFDSEGRELKSDKYFNLSTPNGYSRLKGYAAFLANYIADTEKMKKENNLNADTAKFIQFREKYVEKVFKWLGRRGAVLIPGCVSYKVTLLTIVPVDIWSDRGKIKPELYVVKETHFPVQ